MTEVIDSPRQASLNPSSLLAAAGPALPAELELSDRWTDEMVAAAGLAVRDTAFATVGGGIGSFVMVDYLRVAGGLPTSGILVLSNLGYPWQTYEHLTRVSQISRQARIRSDAASRPDNLWGFPSYALQEAVRHRTLAPLLQVLVEPVLADFYTPRLGAVLEGIEREARRIRYWDMLLRGEVQMVRRRVGGGYFAVLAGQHPGSSRALAVRCRDVHLAVGYTGLKFLPEVQEFRTRMNDFHHVVNAYEDHDHIYQALCRRPGTVLVRGGGIVASRVLERLIQDRLRYGLQTRILHLLRTYVAGPHGRHPWARRRGGNGFAYQGFNYPKSVWGGQLKTRMRRLEGADRVRLYAEIEGTTTAWRRSWQRQLQTARDAGWYRAVPGTIDEIQLEDGVLVTQLRVPQDRLELRADFVIDCTGLNADVREHRVLGDLLDHGGARLNPLGRLDVDRSFELRGTDSGEGRLYLSGAAALGGYFPGVDTFLGLQIAAQEIVDDMARRGYCRRMGPVTSTAQWLKWATGKQI